MTYHKFEIEINNLGTTKSSNESKKKFKFFILFLNKRYLYGVLSKNTTVNENNRELLIESLCSISEILIWGDQNDSTVFEFFLEKHMINFFSDYMKQKHGRFICVQLLQTLNIMFENIRNQKSFYSLLSNNYINNIIAHKFDFSDEEVMAYYISFLKTLSLKLNPTLINFFFTEVKSEFPLFVEAIKFYDHPEDMVKIAVRTLTLNVLKVKVPSMQRFIKDKIAVHFFSNIVWLIRNHVLDLDSCVKNTVDYTKRSRLIGLIDEYIDYLSYLQDIYSLQIEGLNQCISEQLIRRLIVPIYFNSLLRHSEHHHYFNNNNKPFIQPHVATFLLAHIFQIIKDGPFLTELCELMFMINSDKMLNQICCPKMMRSMSSIVNQNNLNENEVDDEMPGNTQSNQVNYLLEPPNLIASLAKLSKTGTLSESKRPHANSSLRGTKVRSRSVPHFLLNDSLSSTTKKDQNVSIIEANEEDDDSNDEQNEQKNDHEEESQSVDDIFDKEMKKEDVLTFNTDSLIEPSNNNNITDDEKSKKLIELMNQEDKKREKNVFESLLHLLDIEDYNELDSLLVVSCLVSMFSTQDFAKKMEKYLPMISESVANLDGKNPSTYYDIIINKLIGIISKSNDSNIEYKVRLATLELSINLIKKFVEIYGAGDGATSSKSTTVCKLNDFHYSCIDYAREQSAHNLRNMFKTEEMFLDIFEHEYYNSQVNFN
jgi:protein CLEC16A